MVENSTAKAKALKGWTLRDAAGHVYHYPSSYRLGPDRRVKIHTGHGSNTQANLYWGSGQYIWNNDKDTATLKRPNSTVADRCSYNNPNANFKIC
jgi:Lamin Tail Domain